ncbi:aromatic-L-amino-acid decarboxylase-like [Actinia tenebrosa]|uniref:Aromatic-L-amino-acid decarboxylase n=1 Tax=Actinia tenebrosa TaxID=6105 RepID=A0A6P8HVE2_ACTTE|nr:aromatic-L-amino-acid decarboxylase-like [Actinia tenebrosa]
MDAKEFRERGKEMIDYIADYHENIASLRVNPDVKPGFLIDQLPPTAPEKGETFTQVFEDFQRQVMPGITHWSSPHFRAYFPSNTSFPSILGDMLSSAIGGVGFSWDCNPSSTELEIVVLDWLGKMINLPGEFLAMNPEPRSDGKRGGGVIQSTASEAVLVAMLAAKKAALDRLHASFPKESEAMLNEKLVAYSSMESHSSVEKAATITGNKIRSIQTDDQGVLLTQELQETIKADKANGFYPFFVCATLGTTNVCSFDNLEDIGPICKKENMWLHIDAAYAGSFFICPEYRTYMKGVEFADSFNFNAHKNMLTNFDCSPLWVKDRDAIMGALYVKRSYLKNVDTDVVTDFRNWQIPLGRRFRALKLWCVMRCFGVEGIQEHVRHHIRMTKVFEELVVQDDRFEFWPKIPNVGLVCFRLKDSDELTKMLADSINNTGQLFVLSVVFKNKQVIRFHGGVGGKEDHVYEDWNTIRRAADALLDGQG